MIAVCEARGYDIAKYRAEFHYALVAGHWFEPLEQTVALSQRAREGLVRGGDYHFACLAYYVSVTQSLEYTPTLDAYLADVEAGLAFATRTGHDQAAASYQSYRQLASMLQGRSQAEPAADIAALSQANIVNVHITGALAATVLGDNAKLKQETSAIAALPHREWTYVSVWSHLLRGLSQADEVRTLANTEVDAGNRALAELDRIVDWLAARAEDAPHNLKHLLRLVEAERAWAVGDFRAAVHHYDAAIGEVTTKRRPWHHALIHERAARFYLAHGVECVGHWLLAEARRAYQDWGAVAKVNQLDWAYTTVRPPDQPHELPVQRTHLATGAIDLMAILAASRALSSQTTIQGLYVQLVDILTGVTGATDIHLLIRDQHPQRWQVVTRPSVSVSSAWLRRFHRQRPYPA